MFIALSSRKGNKNRDRLFVAGKEGPRQYGRLPQSLGEVVVTTRVAGSLPKQKKKPFMMYATYAARFSIFFFFFKCKSPWKSRENQSSSTDREMIRDELVFTEKIQPFCTSKTNFP